MKNAKIFLLFSLMLFSLLLVGGMAVYAQADDTTQQGDDTTQPATIQQPQTNSVYDIIVSEPRLSSFELLVNAAALADNLEQAGPFTVFAPTNDAWEAFEAMREEEELDVTLTEILLYHVANGNYTSGAVATRASVTSLLGEPISLSSDSIGARLEGNGRIAAADMTASNGVVHIIDTVLIPPANSLGAAQLGAADMTIAEVLANDGRFETLLALMEQASLLDELENMNAQHTLFAPTDDAFAAVPEETLGEWFAAGNDQLVGLMAYHLVTDRLGINQIATDDLIPTLEGRPLFVTTDDRLGVYLNGEPISDFNIVASNGVIHVVDSVLVP